jgi:hypothetical protein
MIVAAAIRAKNGCVWLGKRHCHILADAAGSLKGCPQGFINDRGCFLDREEAAQEALACGQIKQLRYNSTKLYSEDLW